jgi:hypothetical protein
MVLFLKSLKLVPWDFDELSATLGGSPFIGEIVREGMKLAQAVVALFTPDEFAMLRPTLNHADATGPEVKRWQARPNVIYEAGMAMGLDSKRTVLVTLGTDVSLFSDVYGIHIVRLDNSPKQRHLLREKLVNIGCSVDMEADCLDVSRAGDFESSLVFTNEPRVPPEIFAKPSSFGEWNCTWHAGKNWLTVDRVRLTRASDVITGEGENDEYGKYYMYGKISESNMITLEYHGDQSRYHARGVILLCLNVTMDKMEGRWLECGYHGTRKFASGTTTWKKTAN